MIRNARLILLLMLVVTSCTGSPLQGAVEDPTQAPANPDAPVSSDQPVQTGGLRSPLDVLPDEDKMVRGSVVIDQSELILLESYPLQIRLHVKGNLPTPCHFLRASLAKPDADNQIKVELYSLAETGTICIQVLQPFDENIPMGSYPDGKYSVLVNDVVVGEFTQ